MTNNKLLLCTDLDRTLIPNGPQPESPEARQIFHQMCASESLTLAYVSGRHRELVEDAISQYDLPLPDYVVGDVGTTIYRVDGAEEWRHLTEWEDQIGRDWKGNSHSDLSRMFTDLSPLRQQEEAKQNRYKLSYYISLDADREQVDAVMRQRLEAEDVNATLIWSVDESDGIGLLDVLPARATKLHAVEFLMQSLGFSTMNTVFSGDSGNDMPVLVSEIPAVLVSNAQPEVREEASDEATRHSTIETLYFAQGGFMSMNGNYSAGIIEGIAHYHPDMIESLLRNKPMTEPE
ncbi:MAG: HAD-IIB family hydrolase [Candidatus Thiodiazotropha sp. (ex Monitilora ramsayi)]|nr:HAD-IIB family hydrolase [Candidatus Thiodiazotropha sp. (ex Monitilora ramsayi)]